MTALDTGIKEMEKEESQLLDVRQMATQLNCSPRSVYRLSDAGRMPRPIKLGALVRWNRQAIDQWIADGCPSIESTNQCHNQPMDEKEVTHA